MHLSTIYEWLDHIASLHAKEIDLGLERVKEVASRLNLLSPQSQVIVVGGTNGKGSTVAGLESIYQAANYRTGVYTSPFLFHYNEQIKLDGEMVKDEDLCRAFEKVEAAREGISLTPFEFGTLAAMTLFQELGLDVWILEVGLGGRLDAVNIMDADVAVITSIDRDHMDWLGDTREKIAFEKAGIFRAGKPVVCGELNPPATLTEAARGQNSPFYQRGLEFNYQEKENTWIFTNSSVSYENLPRNTLATENMSVVLQVVSLLQESFPVGSDAIGMGLRKVNLPGRIQIISGEITEIYDVSHNPAAAGFLKKKLNQLPVVADIPRFHAVFSMLKDKDIVSTIDKIKDKIHFWYVAPVNTKRKPTQELLEQAFEQAGIRNKVLFFQTLEEAYREARSAAVKGEGILIFGSFYTVSEIFQSRSHF